MKLVSSAFSDGERIPLLYTGMGKNISPAMEWLNVPSEAKTFVLIAEDPDAPKGHGMDHPFVHWLVYDIPANVHFLPEGLSPEAELYFPVRCKQGRNSFGSIGYGGPLPPEGHGIHDYLFTLHALDRELGLQPGIGKEELLKAIDGHILNSTKLIGSFEREAARDSAEVSDDDDFSEREAG